MTATELVPHPTGGTLTVDPTQHGWTPEQEAALRHIGLAGASKADADVFLHYCQRTGLDPFAKQIYMIGRWSPDGTKYTIQASIDGLRIVALRSGQYDGQEPPQWCGEDGIWRDVWLSDKPPAAARVGVRRRGFSAPVYGVALYREYVQTKKGGEPTQMWKDKPAGQLAKCAEALGLRKAFPHDLAGVYTDDEMGRADEPQTTQAPPTRGTAGLAAALAPTPEPEVDATGQPYADGVVVEDQNTDQDAASERLPDAQPEPVAQDPEPASEAQGSETGTLADPRYRKTRDRIMAMSGEAGLDGRAVRVAFIKQHAGREGGDPITSANDLTPDEASRVIDALQVRIDGAK